MRDLFAIAAPGLSEAVAREVAALPGVGAVAASAGGVAFRGPMSVCLEANLRLRVATRVLVRVGEVRARDFATLRHGLADLRWEDFVAPGVAGAAGVLIRGTASSHKSRLIHTGALVERLALAVGDRLGSKVSVSREAAAVPIFLRGERDRFVVSVDSSGALLHQRGYRPETGSAPMRETLAAGIVELSGWDGTEPFVDPMCGGGTLAIEACTRALGLAPGRNRGFAFERWPCFDAVSFAAVTERVRAEARSRLGAPVFARDVDEAAIARARRSAERAGVLSHIDFALARFPSDPPPCRSGLLVFNPPYGRRLGSVKAAKALLQDVGSALKQDWRGFKAAILVADPDAERALGRAPERVFPLDNGGLRVRLLLFAAHDPDLAVGSAGVHSPAARP